MKKTTGVNKHRTPTCSTDTIQKPDEQNKDRIIQSLSSTSEVQEQWSKFWTSSKEHDEDH